MLYLQDNNSPIIVKNQIDAKPFPNRITFTPVIFDIETYDSGAALEIASEKLDLFRAIINMSLVIHKYTYFRSVPHAMSKILPSPIYVIICDGKIDNVYSQSDKYHYKRVSIPEGKLSFIASLTLKFGNEPEAKSTWKFIKQILLLYQNSLDIVSPEFTFLSLWQVLENCLSLNETSINVVFLPN